jgi:proline racemase
MSLNASLTNFKLPSRLFGKDKLVIKSVDCHAGGEPARVIIGGVPPFPANTDTAQKKRLFMMEHMDNLRRILLLEPRGYPCQNVDYVFEPEQEGGKLQYVIGEQNKIYPLMSGHNTVCVATAVLETGIVPMVEPVTNFTLEAPAGPIEVTAECKNGKAVSIALKNTVSFVEHLDVVVNVPHGIGNVTVDIAYGGMWYAVVDLAQFEKDGKSSNGSGDDSSSSSSKSDSSNGPSLKLDPKNAAELCRVGEMIKVACREQYPVNHPDINYPGVDVLVFRGKPTPGSGAHARNTVVMSNNELDWNKPETWTGMLDRSPCGTGTCAVMATMHARGLLKVGEPFIHESIVGSQFIGTILEETKLKDGRIGMIPEIKGSSCITQYSEIVVDENDIFPEGYTVSDIW